MKILQPVLLAQCLALFEGSKLDGVPTVDLNDDHEKASAMMGDALRTYGFFYVTNHGIPTRLIEQQFEQSRALFSLPLSTKRSMKFVEHLDIGYLDDQALDEESGVKDTKEGFLLSNNGVILDPNFDVDPRNPLAGAELKLPPLADYESVMRDWARALWDLNNDLNVLMFKALGLEETERQRIARQPFFVIKQLRYGAATKPDDNGAGAHADWGALTLLVTDGVPGLEVEYNGTWVPVPPRPDAIIVNAGDQTEFWSSGTFRSANHRAITSVIETVSSRRAYDPLSHQVRSRQQRFSTAFFAYFDYHKIIDPIRITDEPSCVDNSTASDAAGDRADVRARFLATNKHFGKTTGDYFAYKLCESLGLLEDACQAYTRPKA